MKISVLCIVALAMPAALAQWEPDVRLTAHDSSAHTSFSNTRSIAVGPDSTVHVFWYDGRDGQQGEIYYKRSTDNGTTWSDDVRLTRSSGVSEDPCVARSGDSLHLVWYDTRDNVWGEVYYKRSLDAGLTWSEDLRLTSDSAYSRNPVVAADGRLVHMVWDDEGRQNPGPEIYYLCSTDAGVTWSAPLRLTYAQHESWYPGIALSGGCVHVAWRDWRDRSFEVWYKRSTDRGLTWDSVDTRLSEDLTKGSYNPVLAASGNAVHVIWWDTRHVPFELYYRRSLDSGASWDQETRLTVDSSGSYNPAVAADGPNVHVFWEALAEYLPEIMYKFSTDNGTTWSPDTQLTPRPGAYAVSPSCAVQGPALHLIWTDFRDHERGQVYYKRNLTGNTVGMEDSREAERLPRNAATIAHGSMVLTGGEELWLRDITGRRVMLLQPGLNVISALAPGVYFSGPGNRCVVKIR
ncbi:MAG: exo-alpha-sialidase [candidate division WOR-3 bacterium]|nr:MAG: exo-alpha-sialidase [candidate division WOR-3 bacterium]